MRITTFNPQIVTKNAEPIVQLFEELGFQKTHNPKNLGDLDVNGIRMKDENGFYLDISVPDVEGTDLATLIPHDMTAIRMNVDDFDAVYELLEKRGFRNVYGDGKIVTPSVKAAMVISPSGFAINLVQHIKKED